METSGKTGAGVEALLERVVSLIPSPKAELADIDAQGNPNFRGLVFDFQYSNHRGVIVYIRVMEGQVKKGDELLFKIAGEKFFNKAS